MLTIVRHGRTPANASGELLGRRDQPLDDLGRVQALEIGTALHDVERIISSPLTRCVETAQAIRDCGHDDVGIEVDERFIEIDYGTLEGAPVGDIPAGTWARWRSDPSWSPGGAESLDEVSIRVAAALDALRDSGAAVQSVVIVSHVSPIKAAIGWALGMGPDIAWRCHVAQASIHRILIEGDLPRLLEFQTIRRRRDTIDVAFQENVLCYSPIG